MTTSTITPKKLNSSNVSLILEGFKLNYLKQMGQKECTCVNKTVIIKLF